MRRTAATSCRARGGHPEWHIQSDALEVAKMSWDMVLAFPPCTHLSSSGARWFAEKRRDGRQQMGIGFFLAFTALDHVPRVAIENPVGIMSKLYRKPDQIIQPWQFGHPETKATCLWLKGLPPLRPTRDVRGGDGRDGRQGQAPSAPHATGPGEGAYEEQDVPRRRAGHGRAVGCAGGEGAVMADGREKGLHHHLRPLRRPGPRRDRDRERSWRAEVPGGVEDWRERNRQGLQGPLPDVLEGVFGADGQVVER